MPATSWNITIDSPSPALSYYPYSESGSFTDGWTTYVPQLGFNNATGESTEGYTTLHVTALSGASMKVQFYGTGIVLNGYANCSYSITLDNEPQNLDSAASSSEMLFASRDLTAGTHFVTLTTLSNSSDQQLVFENAVISIPTDSSPPTPAVYENWNSTLLYEGSWSKTLDPEVPNPSDPQAFETSTTKGDTVSLAFSGASAVAINASINYGHGLYLVMLDGVETYYNGSSLWLIPNTYLFFHAGLDPTQTHTINLTNNLFGAGNKLTFSSFTVYHVNQTSSSGSHKTSHAGAITGGVIGGVVLLALVLLSLFFWRRLRGGGPYSRLMFRSSPHLPKEEVKIQPFELTQPALDSASPTTTVFSTGPSVVRPDAGGVRSGRHLKGAPRLEPLRRHTTFASITPSFDPPGSINPPTGSDARSLSGEGRPCAPAVRPLYVQDAGTTLEGSTVVAHPEEVANRILEIISSRIDMPIRQSQPATPLTAPPQYES